MKNTSNLSRILLCAAALAAALSVQSLRADDLADKARGILKNGQTSLITVTALSKLDFGGTGLPIRIAGLGEAQESSCNGLVLDKSGLTVVSYTALNPAEKLSQGIKIKTGDGDDSNEIKSKTQLTRVQMRLGDGTEIPAHVVFKDKELDLAFLVPDAKDGDKTPLFTPVKLNEGATAVELDDTVVLSRHGKDLGCQPIINLDRVTSVITKPRFMYDLAVPSSPGAVVYLPDGRLLGMAVATMSGGGMMGMLGTEVLVLPAAEINKLADQARKAADKKAKESSEVSKE